MLKIPPEPKPRTVGRQLKEQTVKVKYKNISKFETDNWTKSNHLVLAYGVWDDNSKIFLIADRELSIIEPYDKNLEIVDNDLTVYENYPKLNYGKEFYVHKEFLSFVKQFENYHEFKFESLWIKCKLYRFYENNKFELSKSYKETVLSEHYKLGVIEGFLSFANHFINEMNQGSSYRNHFYFKTTNNIDKIIPEKFKDDQHYKFEKIDLNNYELELLGFISEKLYYNEFKERKRDKNLIRDFFEKIDCLFFSKPLGLYRINTFYDDMFVIEYDEKFYYLNYDWTS